MQLKSFVIKLCLLYSAYNDQCDRHITKNTVNLWLNGILFLQLVKLTLFSAAFYTVFLKQLFISDRLASSKNDNVNYSCKHKLGKLQLSCK